MKRLFLTIFILFLTPLFSYAEEVASENIEESQPEEYEVLNGYVEYYPEGTVFFDEIKDSEGIYIEKNRPTTYNQYSVLDIKGVNYEEIKNRQVGKASFAANEYRVDNFVTSVTEQHGKFTYGTIYGADIDTGEYEYSTKFFARYDTKHLGFQFAFGKDTYTSTGKQADYIYLTPEWKIGKGFALSETFKANTLGTRTDNTIMLRYTPQFIKEKPLDVGVGVGQTIYDDGTKKNVVKFETTLRL